jgi:xylose isomerase
MVVDYKHRIGFKGTILIEPKPQEPTKHQYDYDVATVYGFLKDFGLETRSRSTSNRATRSSPATPSSTRSRWPRASASSGSIDMNRNDYQSGWDTDQFPNNHAEKTLAYYEILKAGGFTTGGTNFDAKIRRQSLDPADLILAHVGGMDTCARGLQGAAAMLEDGTLEKLRSERYAGWDSAEARAMLNGTLEDIEARVIARDLRPEPRSGRQERLENLVNRFV